MGGKRRLILDFLFQSFGSTRRFFAKRSYALDSLDLRLRRFISFNDGFFVEAGANDGVVQSNTLYLEKYANWRGLLVEPIPELAAKCERNRPNCIVENCALVPFGHSHSDIEMQYCNLMSIVKGARGSAEQDTEHVAAGVRVQPGVVPYALRVRARPLSEVLDAHGIVHVDFLSLDVEGFELDVLRGLDTQRHQPLFILVETAQPEQIDGALSPHYERIAMLSYHDYLYQRR